MDKLEVLRRISFGERVAEEESDSLASYFVETDDWRRLYQGDVDVVYGPKGSGKSALYSLLVARTDDVFDRRILLIPAENPRGTPAFKNLVVDPPASEPEFVALWKLYFALLVHQRLADYDIQGIEADELKKALVNAGLVRQGRTLEAALRAVWDYVRRTFRPESVEAQLVVATPDQSTATVSGRITFAEPSTAEAATGAVSVNTLLGLANNALRNSGFRVWILLDRLDVAFAENADLEHNALRALFRSYLDMLGFDNIKLKIFLRWDIWKRISAGGFREASHITRHMTIEWSGASLLNLVVRRAAHNAVVQEYYGITDDSVVATARAQHQFFYAMFPEQVDLGLRRPKTFEWILGRTRDSTAKNAPRELIHLLNLARDKQIKRLELGEGESDPEEQRLFVRAVFKDALPEVSQVRLEQTLYAEYPRFRVPLEKLRGQKTQHTLASLSRLWTLPLDQTEKLAQELVEAGFFELRGTREAAEYKVPFLYRDALELIQGSAE